LTLLASFLLDTGRIPAAVLGNSYQLGLALTFPG
jgi:hypothetical protein